MGSGRSIYPGSAFHLGQPKLRGFAYLAHPLWQWRVSTLSFIAWCRCEPRRRKL